MLQVRLAAVFRCPAFPSGPLCLCHFLGGRILVELDDGLTRIVPQTIMRIAAQKHPEGRARSVWISKIVFVDFTDRKQTIETVLDAGILAAQALLLLDALSHRF